MFITFWVCLSFTGVRTAFGERGSKFSAALSFEAAFGTNLSDLFVCPVGSFRLLFAPLGCSASFDARVIFPCFEAPASASGVRGTDGERGSKSSCSFDTFDPFRAACTADFSAFGVRGRDGDRGSNAACDFNADTREDPRRAMLCEDPLRATIGGTASFLLTVAPMLAARL